jgi:hypothetical protein
MQQSVDDIEERHKQLEANHKLKYISTRQKAQNNSELIFDELKSLL